MSQDQNQITTPFQNYKISKQLSSSKYSVFKAFDRKNSRSVALKIFPSKSVHFYMESQIMSQLSHKNVIQIFEEVEYCPLQPQSISYIAIEYAKMGDLFDAISNHGAFEETLARTIFHQLVEGLSYLHSKKVAHLDLKIENILIDENFTFKITDFDLSLQTDQDIDYSKQGGRGTAGYRAPEVKNGTCRDFEAADVYSLGIILFVLICGHPPYAEVATEKGSEYDNFYWLLRKDPNAFWNLQEEHHPGLFSDDLIYLIYGMLRSKSSDRMTLEQIKQHPWFSGPTLNAEEYVEEMKKYYADA